MEITNRKTRVSAICVVLLLALLLLAACGIVTGSKTRTDGSEVDFAVTGLNINMFILPGHADADVRAEERGGVITYIAVFDIANYGCDAVFGFGYRLEAYTGGEWITIKEVTDGQYSSLPNSIPGDINARASFRLDWDGLAPGTYRIAKTFYASHDRENSVEAFAEFTIPEQLPVARPIDINTITPVEIAPEGFGVTIEFVRYASQTVTLVITNNSGYDVRYGSGYELTGNQWGNAGVSDMDSYDLPSGEQHEVQIIIGDTGYGEFRLTKNILVEPENPAARRIYQLQSEFSIENPAIPPDTRGVTMEVFFSTPVGVILDITNGFDSGRIYFDKSYRFQRMANGAWQDLPLVSSNDFPDDMLSLASRQILQLTIYWAWLYGECVPGEYRIEKSFLHLADSGEETQYNLYAVFTLGGEPIPDTINRDDGSSWGHPFGGISTFRAEVTELIDSDFHRVSMGNIGLLVISLEPFWGIDGSGDPFYVWDNSTVAVLNSAGKQIRFSDIPQGAVVDITFSGMILTSLPAHIGGSLLITIHG